MKNPTSITKLVEYTGSRSCTEYFSLHLIQDIRDVTAICNKTFEEAILIVHTMIDHLLTVRPDEQFSTLSMLSTEDDLTRWERAFEETYVYKLAVLNDNVLRERMKAVIDKSRDCDTSLLRVFYEEEESNFNCKLWRYRSIIGYDHLLQVFSSQPLCESNKHPFLRKFLEEQPLLACTRYLPEFVSLYLKLVQKSSLIYNNKKLWNMCISDFLQFINKEESNSYQEYATEFTSMTITSSQLMEEKHKLDTYSYSCVLRTPVTNSNTRVGSLISTSHHKGILTSLINILVNIHNSFITAYTQLSLESNRRETTIPLSLITTQHLIIYTHQLENMIVSNAQQSFQIGEGRLIKYNFLDIERDFCDCFVFGKPSFENDLDVRVSESRLFNNLKTIQINVPQEEVSEDIWNCIKEGLDESVDISGTIDLIELVISFASFGKQRPQQTIKNYMHEVLKYPVTKPLISLIADDKCNLTHLLSLWQKLSILRAKLTPSYSRFSQVPKHYTVGLDTSQHHALKKEIDSNNINDILSIMYPFILFKLHGQIEDTDPPPKQRLQDCLCDFSQWKLSLPHQIINKTIPESILVCHTVNVWSILVEYSKMMQA